MNQEYCIAYCTCPDAETAEKIAYALLEARVAACINCIPNLKSFYVWKGHIEKGEEVLMKIKTTRSKLPALEAAILQLHPYEFPEFIATPVIYGNESYLGWLTEVVG